MMRRPPALALFLALALGPAAAATEEEPSSRRDATGDGAEMTTQAASAPRAVVEGFHALLLGCMKEAEALGFAGRYERILAGLDEAFDMPFMARTSVGSTWKELDAGQRRDFVAQARRYSAANYASNFTGWGGEVFETVSDEPAARKTIVVKTRLVQPPDEDVRFDYRLRNTEGRWRIIDVQLDGKVSEITLRRADYRSVIQRKGFDQLVADIEKKIADFSSE